MTKKLSEDKQAMYKTVKKKNGHAAMIVMASAWKQISYNFVFFMAGLQAIPKSSDLQFSMKDCQCPSDALFWNFHRKSSLKTVKIAKIIEKDPCFGKIAKMWLKKRV